MRLSGSEDLREGEHPAQKASGRSFVRIMQSLKEASEGKLLRVSQRRKMVIKVCTSLSVSERRACRVLGQGEDYTASQSIPQR